MDLDRVSTKQGSNLVSSEGVKRICEVIFLMREDINVT